MLNLAMQNAAQSHRFCEHVLGRPDLLQDHSFGSNELRISNRCELDSVIEANFARRDVEDVIHTLERADVPWGRVNDADALSRHSQLGTRRRRIAVDSPTDAVVALRSPLDMGYSGLGQHTTEVLVTLDTRSADTDADLTAAARRH